MATALAGDFESVLNDGARIALRVRESDLLLRAELAWFWQVVVALQISNFFSSFMNEAGEDAYKQLKRFVGRLHAAAARHKASTAPDIRTIQLQDSDSGLIIPLPDRLPDKAYRQLLTIKLPSLPKGCSPYRLQWLDDHWVLQARVLVPNGDNADDAPSTQESTVLVPLVWNSRDQQWALPVKDELGLFLFMEPDLEDDG